ncbi:hypothetical protein BU23DRAFT_12438 [Bimuria novae-zelandiae CBS 107.79]|uniref:Uncharacterized protein n=1 Tax=Bimuria novae-zelandiae CBS 107.79 TaxID=1447943 RepID=A0A6A5VPG8_9PLEO|nr:hypothetical protein BU23DRAFT_12438 [Bimuria novae-zelandiae CBS 107.79]
MFFHVKAGATLNPTKSTTAGTDVRQPVKLPTAPSQRVDHVQPRVRCPTTQTPAGSPWTVRELSTYSNVRWAYERFPPIGEGLLGAAGKSWGARLQWRVCRTVRRWGGREPGSRDAEDGRGKPDVLRGDGCIMDSGVTHWRLCPQRRRSAAFGRKCTR